MKTISEIQEAIAKGKYVCFIGHNEGRIITYFNVTKRFITIETGKTSVNRYKPTALNFFLSHVQIY